VAFLLVPFSFLFFSERIFFHHRATEITEKKFLYKKLCVLCASVVKINLFGVPFRLVRFAQFACQAKFLSPGLKKWKRAKPKILSEKLLDNFFAVCYIIPGF